MKIVSAVAVCSTTQYLFANTMIRALNWVSCITKSTRQCYRWSSSGVTVADVRVPANEWRIFVSDSFERRNDNAIAHFGVTHIVTLARDAAASLDSRWTLFWNNRIVIIMVWCVSLCESQNNSGSVCCRHHHYRTGFISCQLYLSSHFNFILPKFKQRVHIYI